MVSLPYYPELKIKHQAHNPSNSSWVFVALSTSHELVSHLNSVFPHTVERLPDECICMFLKEICNISLAYLALLQEVDIFHTFSSCKKKIMYFYLDILPIGISQWGVFTVWLLFKDITSYILRTFLFKEAARFVMLLFLSAQVAFCPHESKDWIVPLFIPERSEIISPHCVIFAFLPLIQPQLYVFF